jgi:hypothetical protein
VKIWLIVVVLAGMTAAWLLSWAAPVNPRVDSFIAPAPQSASDLMRITRGSKEFQVRYAAHFAVTPAKALEMLSTLQLGNLKKSQTFRVYCYHPRRGEYSYVATLAKGTPVFMTRSGIPVLKADCGNPLTKHFPTESGARKSAATRSAKRPPSPKPVVQSSGEATLTSHPAVSDTQIPQALPHTAPEITADTAETELLPKLFPADATPPLPEPMQIPGTNVPVESPSLPAPAPSLTTPPTEPGVISLPDKPGVPGWWLLPGIGGLVGGGGGGGGDNGGASPPPPPPDGGGDPPPPPDGGADPPPPPSIPEPGLLSLASLTLSGVYARSLLSNSKFRKRGPG